MNNPTIYSDGVDNSTADSPLRVQNKILGALKNMGGAEVAVDSDTVVDVTDVAGTVLAENVSRKFLTIQNVSTSRVYIRFGADPTLAAYGAYQFSFILKPASGAYEGDGGVLSLQGFTGDVRAICEPTESSTLAVTEFL